MWSVCHVHPFPPLLSNAFKRDPVCLAKEQGNAAEVARDLGVPWVRFGAGRTAWNLPVFGEGQHRMNSYANQVDMVCTDCGHRYDTQIWLIVDLDEQPEFAQEWPHAKGRSVP